MIAKTLTTSSGAISSVIHGVLSQSSPPYARYCWRCNFALGHVLFSHVFLSLSFWLSLLIPQSLIPNTEVCFVVVVHAVSYDYSTSVFLYRYFSSRAKWDTVKLFSILLSKWLTSWRRGFLLTPHHAWIHESMIARCCRLSHVHLVIFYDSRGTRLA